MPVVGRRVARKEQHRHSIKGVAKSLQETPSMNVQSTTTKASAAHSSAKLNCTKLLFLLLAVLVVTMVVAHQTGNMNFTGNQTPRHQDSKDGIQYKITQHDVKHSTRQYRYSIYQAYFWNKAKKKQEPLSVKEWVDRMASSSSASTSLIDTLAACPYEAFFFETKGVNPNNASVKIFEFALVNAPRLYQFAESNPDFTSFSEHVDSCIPESVAGCAFPNLRKDALLVAPKRRQQEEQKPGGDAYSHLAAFIRRAPRDQVQELWQLTSKEYQTILSDKENDTVWFSTCGTGVAWLHFRFDSRPKYYQYSKFANET